MRWGRRARVEVTESVATPKPPASSDALKTSEYKQRAKVGGTAALNTKELQELVNRQNLEQQYDRLNPAPIGKGQKFMTETLPTVMGVASTGAAAYRTFYPKQEIPPSTDLRMVSGKQKAGDMVLHLGKQLVKEHGMTLGKMALDAMMSSK